MTSLSIPANYGWVVLAAVSSGYLGVWQSMVVSKARKAAGIKYPAPYAANELADTSAQAKTFNCAVRAAANTLESLPFFLFALLFSGIEFPLAAAALGFTWVSGRVFYTIGYATGNPAKRLWGVWHNIGYLGLLLTSTYSAYNLVK